MRKLLVSTVIVIAVAMTGGTSTANAEKVQVKCPGIVKGVNYYRQATWQWQDKLDIERTRAARETFHSCKFARWTAHLWMKRARVHRQKYHRHVILMKKWRAQGSVTSDWACIHRYEGAWDANTGNGYYGGLQMNLVFQRSYGPEFMARWGTADNWPVWAQVIAANRAKKVRGYSPWPNTARACGLL